MQIIFNRAISEARHKTFLAAKMLAKWSIANFKSFGQRTEIQLAPITVIAGANSSGKSTIIQSILLLKQTLQYGPANKAIGLNGPILKLGRFDDVMNVNADGNNIQISWTVTDIGRYRFQGSFNEFEYMYLGLYNRNDINSVSCSLSFSADSEGSAEFENTNSIFGSELNQLQPVLTSVNLDCEYVGRNQEEETTIKSEIQLTRNHNKYQKLPPPNTPSLIEDKGLFGMNIIYIDKTTKADIVQQRPDANLTGANLRYFLPNQVGYTYNKRKDLAHKVSLILTSPIHTVSYLYDNEVSSVKIPREVMRYLVDTIQSAQNIAHQISVSTYARNRFTDASRLADSRDFSAQEGHSQIEMLVRSLNSKAQVETRSLLAGIQSDLEKRLSRFLKIETDLGFKASSPSVLFQAANQISSFFRNSIRYLGPLRDEPKPIYPLEAVANPTDVGYRGEHTAAVLDLNKDRQISYISSKYAISLVGAQAEQGSLQAAVVDWLSYLGVAAGVRTGDRGKMGHELQVRTGDVSRDHDLTNVGVGVSQLLPIVVMALLAPTPSTLIFEQPELHLHPKVQTRLADFFISLGLVGRQCILETHSEYLIDRLRRRIAEAAETALQSKIKIYFTHKEGGQTICVPVVISEYGAIQNWPPDFFDQSQEETAFILKAAQDKLRSKRQHPSKDKS